MTATRRVRMRSENRQRTCLIAVRLLPHEHDQIRGAAAAAGISVSKFTRDAALDRVRSA